MCLGCCSSPFVVAPPLGTLAGSSMRRLEAQMNNVTDEPQQRESNDPTFWSRQLEILYSVLLSASLGVALGTGLPDATWTEFQGARTVWAVTILGVTAVSIDAWYNLNQIIRSAKFGRSQGVQTGILALSFLVFTFFPFQFLVRQTAGTNIWMAVVPISALVINLIAICLLQAIFMKVAEVKRRNPPTKGATVDIELSQDARSMFGDKQLDLLAFSRFLLAVAFAVLYLAAFSPVNAKASAMSTWPVFAVVGLWAIWRVLEHTVGLWVIVQYWQKFTKRTTIDVEGTEKPNED